MSTTKWRTMQLVLNVISPYMQSLIERFMGPTWGLLGFCRPQVGPIQASWTLLSGILSGSDRLLVWSTASSSWSSLRDYGVTATIVNCVKLHRLWSLKRPLNISLQKITYYIYITMHCIQSHPLRNQFASYGNFLRISGLKACCLPVLYHVHIRQIWKQLNGSTLYRREHIPLDRPYAKLSGTDNFQ